MEDKELERMREMLEKEIDKETGKEETSERMSERFDTKYRSKIWMMMNDIYEKNVDVKKKKDILKKIVKMDLMLFHRFMKKNHESIKQNVDRKSFRLVEAFKRSTAYNDLINSDEFIINKELNLKLFGAYEYILNYFYLIEFYIAPKLKHQKNLPFKGYWTFGLAVETVVFRTFSMLATTSTYVIDVAFSNPTLTKNLVSFGLLAYFGLHPSFLAVTQNTTMYAVMLPAVGKFLRWCGIFEYISTALTLRDTENYIQAMNKSLADTIELLSEVKLLVGTELQNYLDQPESDESDRDFFVSMGKIMKKFGGGFESLQKFITEKTDIELLRGVEEDGWVRVEKRSKVELEDFKSTYYAKK